MKTILPLLAVASLFLAFTIQASADDGHPGYLHALSDLRMARFLLQRENPGPHDQYAIDEIDRAIDEIKRASIDDGKNLNDHPQADPTWNDVGRFHHALELLDRAHQDIVQGETDTSAPGLRHRALEHIDNAHHAVKDIVNHW